MIVGLNVAPWLAARLSTATAMAVGFGVGGLGLTAALRTKVEPSAVEAQELSAIWAALAVR
ncbi:hypothetical protein [Kribbella sp. NPDC023855]|uniref:hypothetical protein n=1 Tax=Kribbella sp. NPDC023855 TaxID=3154698 RepID=UPI0033E58A62